MLQWVLLGISLLSAVILVYHSLGLLKIFHWYELLILFLYIASVNSWCFNLYQSAYETLNVIRKPKEYMIAYIQFVLIFPILMLWVVRLFKRKVSRIKTTCYFFLWNLAYVFVIEFNVFVDVMEIKYSHWYPVLITTGYNIITLVLTIFFMKFLKEKLIKEEKWYG